MMSLHGISHDAWKRYAKEGSWYYEVLHPGFKYNLTDIGAAIGIEQLKKCDAFWRRQESYRGGLQRRRSQPYPRFRLQYANPIFSMLGIFMSFSCTSERLKITRDQFIEALKEYGIGTSVHFIPLHLHPYYRESFGYAPDDFPTASAVYRADYIAADLSQDDGSQYRTGHRCGR